MYNFLFSFNVVMPVFLIIMLGFFLKHIDLVDDRFIGICTKLNFKIFLPILLFKNIYASEISSIFNYKFILFNISCIINLVVLLWMLTPIFIKDSKKISAIIHTTYRSNFILLGTPIAIKMFGDSIIGIITGLTLTIIPIYNILAVVILTYFNHDYSIKNQLKSTIIKIFKNPLIISSFLGIITQLTYLKLPLFVVQMLTDVAGIGTPIALITIGAQISLKKTIKNLKYSLVLSIIKLILIPSIIMMLAILCGFRGYELGSIFVVFSSPTTITSYIMAKEMNSDYELTSDIILISTLFSPFTIFIGIYLLRLFLFIYN